MNPSPLVAAVLSGLQRGFTFSRELAGHAEAVFGLLSTAELRRLPGSSEFHETGLAGLLFQPDEAARLAVEPLLPDAGLTADAIMALTAAVTAARPLVPICFQGEDCTVTFAGDGRMVALFAAALHLDFPMWLGEVCPASSDLGLRLRVTLRSRAPRLATPARALVLALLRRLLEEAPVDAADTLRLLRYALLLLAGGDAADDPWARLEARKRELQRELEGLTSFREMFGKRFAMDYLMGQRVQVPTIDPVWALAEIRCIDRICLAVAGRPAEGLVPIRHAREEVNLEHGDAVEAMLRLLE